MEQIHRSSIEADNRLRSLDTDKKRLEIYHNMLNNISTQATLLLGFSMATYGADILPNVLNDGGRFCFYKTWTTQMVGCVFLFCNTCNICFCLLVILSSSYLIWRSQTALLYVGGAAAVWRTHQLCQNVYVWYGGALTAFITNAMLFTWIHLGFGQWHVLSPDELSSEGFLSMTEDEIDAYVAEDEVTIRTHGGKLLRKCLDPLNDGDHTIRDSFGLTNALISQVTFFVFLGYLYYMFITSEAAYALDAAKGSAAVKREEQAARDEMFLFTDVKRSKQLQRDARRALEKAERKEFKAIRAGAPSPAPAAPAPSAAVMNAVNMRETTRRPGEEVSSEVLKRRTALEKATKKLKRAEKRLEAARMEAEKAGVHGRNPEQRKVMKRMRTAVRGVLVWKRRPRLSASENPWDRAEQRYALGPPGTPPPPQQQRAPIGAPGASPVLPSPPLASLLQSKAANDLRPKDDEIDSMA